MLFERVYDKLTAHNKLRDSGVRTLFERGATRTLCNYP
jgi:hypothetical protein